MKQRVRKVLAVLLSILLLLPGMANTLPAAVNAAEPAITGVTFTLSDADQTESFDSVTLSVYTDSKHKIAVYGTTDVKARTVLFTPSDKLDTDALYYYQISAQTYQTVSGTFKGSDTKVDVALTSSLKDPALKAEDLSLPYGTERDLPVTYDTGYDGIPAYTVISGSDVITLTDTGHVSAVKTGTAEVHVALPETAHFKKAESDLTITVTVPAITIHPISMTYGDKPVDLTDSVVTDSRLDTPDVQVLSGDDVLSVHGTSITALKAGSSRIRLSYTVAGMDDPFTADITVTVAKKDLGLLTKASFEDVTKIYDGTTSVSTKGAVSPDLLEDGDTLTVSASADTGKADAGTYTGLPLTDFQLEDNDKYTADLSSMTGMIEAVITPADVRISPNAISVMYGSELWKQLTQDYQAVYQGDTLLNEMTVQTQAPDSVKAEYQADLKAAVTVQIDSSAAGFPVGVYGQAVTLSVNPDIPRNFHITIGDSASLTVTAEVTADDQALWKRLSLLTGAAGVYQAPDGTIYLANGSKAVFQVKSGDIYDSVAIRVSGDYSDTITGIASDGAVSGQFYLYNSRYTGTRTDSGKADTKDNHIPNGAAYFDTTAPDVKLDILGVSALTTQTESNISYSKILNTGSLAVTAAFKDAGSGVDTAEYAVLSYNPEAPDSDTLISRFEKADKKQWKNETVNVLRNVPDGHYVLVIRVTDHVGNTGWYVTDGITVDTKAPVVTLDGIDESRIYNSDIAYTLTVADAGSGVSGIQSVEVSAAKDGAIFAGSAEVKSNSWAIDPVFSSDMYKPEQIKAAGQTISYQGTLTKDINRNGVTITVTVKDRAGNTTTLTKTFSIDTDAPVISVSYDNNRAANDRYFQDTRTATVHFTERNFQESGARFAIGIDGAQADYSVEDLRKGRAAGIRLLQESREDDGITYTILFGDEDHDYTFRTAATDAAGNVSSGWEVEDGTVAADTFTIDRTAPTASVSYTAGNIPFTPGSADPYYTNQSVTAVITIIDHNFNAGASDYTFSQTDVNGGTVSAYAESSFDRLQNDASWSRSGDTLTLTLPVFDGDANYTLGFSFEDMAGNTVSVPTGLFTVDKTSPTGEITVQAGTASTSSSSENGLAAFHMFSDSGATAWYSADDAVSGVADVSYWIYYPDVESRSTFTLPGSSAAYWMTWKGELTIVDEAQFVLYARITDRAGNITYINTADGTVIDRTSPNAPAIEITGGIDGIANRDVPITIAVTDPVSGGTYAGLASVTYTILSDGAVTQSGSYDSELGDPTARVQAIVRNETVLAALNNSNDVVVRVTARDYAGNTSSAEQSLKIDISAPEITVSYDQEHENGQYNTDRAATIAVRERNFDPTRFNLTVTSVLGNNAEIGEWNLSPLMGQSDDAVSTLTVVFSKDDDYTLTASMTDMAGNTAELGRTDTFTIDQTAPALSITIDPDEPSDGLYYNSTRTATITVTDRYFNPDAFTLDITADSGAVPALSGWSTSGDLHTATLIFDQDGTYSFRCLAADIAGNASEQADSGEFIIDTTAPDVVISGIEDKTAYNDNLNIAVDFTDANIGPLNAVVTLTGSRHGTKVLNGTVVSIDNGWRMIIGDIDKSRDTDDVYTLTADATDLAGNRYTSTKIFSVNRYGSTYEFTDDTRALLDQYYLQTGQDLEIHEINVDPLSNFSVTLGINGTAKTLTEGRDFTITENDTNGWKEYDYRIRADVFKDEGVYDIVITSQDTAGNEQNTQLKDVPITFVIDKTAPSCVVNDLTDRARYSETVHKASAVVSDTFAMSSVEVYLNGQKAQSYDAWSLSQAGNTISIDIPESNTYQTVYVVCTDAAGNKTQSDTYTVLVTSNALLRWYYNLPVFIGTLLVLLTLIVLLTFLIRRKAKERKNAPSKN